MPALIIASLIRKGKCLSLKRCKDFFIEYIAVHGTIHVDRVIRETGRAILNGFEEIYVNTKINDGSEIAELMEVFNSSNIYNNKFPITSGIKRRYKETEEGQKFMCEIMAKIAEEERREGKAEGEARVNQLNSILLDTNRLDDLKRAVRDKLFQAQLMAELLPEES